MQYKHSNCKNFTKIFADTSDHIFLKVVMLSHGYKQPSAYCLTIYRYAIYRVFFKILFKYRYRIFVVENITLDLLLHLDLHLRRRQLNLLREPVALEKVFDLS